MASTDAYTSAPAPGGRFLFERVLLPHRSLPPRGFHLLMLVLGAVSLAVGIAFVSIGAWPVFGFFGLDVGLVYFAFRINYRSARHREIASPRRVTSSPSSGSASTAIAAYGVSSRSGCALCSKSATPIETASLSPRTGGSSPSATFWRRPPARAGGNDPRSTGALAIRTRLGSKQLTRSLPAQSQTDALKTQYLRDPELP